MDVENEDELLGMFDDAQGDEYDENEVNEDDILDIGVDDDIDLLSHCGEVQHPMSTPRLPKPRSNVQSSQTSGGAPINERVSLQTRELRVEAGDDDEDDGSRQQRGRFITERGPKNIHGDNRQNWQLDGNMGPPQGFGRNNQGPPNQMMHHNSNPRNDGYNRGGMRGGRGYRGGSWRGHIPQNYHNSSYNQWNNNQQRGNSLLGPGPGEPYNYDGNYGDNQQGNNFRGGGRPPFHRGGRGGPTMRGGSFNSRNKNDNFGYDNQPPTNVVPPMQSPPAYSPDNQTQYSQGPPEPFPSPAMMPPPKQDQTQYSQGPPQPFPPYVIFPPTKHDPTLAFLDLSRPPPNFSNTQSNPGPSQVPPQNVKIYVNPNFKPSNANDSTPATTQPSWSGSGDQNEHHPNRWSNDAEGDDSSWRKETTQPQPQLNTGITFGQLPPQQRPFVSGGPIFPAPQVQTQILQHALQPRLIPAVTIFRPEIMAGMAQTSAFIPQVSPIPTQPVSSMTSYTKPATGISDSPRRGNFRSLNRRITGRYNQRPKRSSDENKFQSNKQFKSERGGLQRSSGTSDRRKDIYQFSAQIADRNTYGQKIPVITRQDNTSGQAAVVPPFQQPIPLMSLASIKPVVPITSQADTAQRAQQPSPRIIQVSVSALPKEDPPVQESPPLMKESVPPQQSNPVIQTEEDAEYARLYEQQRKLLEQRRKEFLEVKEMRRKQVAEEMRENKVVPNVPQETFESEGTNQEDSSGVQAPSQFTPQIPQMLLTVQPPKIKAPVKAPPQRGGFATRGRAGIMVRQPHPAVTVQPIPVVNQSRVRTNLVQIAPVAASTPVNTRPWKAPTARGCRDTTVRLGVPANPHRAVRPMGQQVQVAVNYLPRTPSFRCRGAANVQLPGHGRGTAKGIPYANNPRQLQNLQPVTITENIQTELVETNEPHEEEYDTDAPLGEEEFAQQGTEEEEEEDFTEEWQWGNEESGNDYEEYAEEEWADTRELVEYEEEAEVEVLESVPEMFFRKRTVRPPVSVTTPFAVTTNKPVSRPTTRGNLTNSARGLLTVRKRGVPTRGGIRPPNPMVAPAQQQNIRGRPPFRGNVARQQVARLPKPQEEDTNTVEVPEVTYTSLLVKNLSASTSLSSLQKYVQQLGSYEHIQLDSANHQATITFKTPEEAKYFNEKFNRRLIDLSMINVEPIA